MKNLVGVVPNRMAPRRGGWRNQMMIEMRNEHWLQAQMYLAVVSRNVVTSR